MESSNQRLRAALFVDFDNIYLGLQALDANAADAFATNPSAWLFWLEEGMPTLRDYGEHELPKRSLLVRRCYLNPVVMRNPALMRIRDCRAHFLRAGFSVIDCPPITAQGKNNADIQMVMDILDTLTHPTPFDEFIILSGDSDFTPVLLRLRAHDRRTSIITAGPSAEAYRAASDRSITPDLFIEFGLGLSPASQEPLAPAPQTSAVPVPDALLDRMAAALYRAASASGELDGAAVPQVLKEFEEFKPRSNWMGFGTLRRLSQELVDRNHRLRWVESDPWRIRLEVRDVRQPVAEQGPPVSYEPPVVNVESELSRLEKEIVRITTEFVERALTPPTMAEVAAEIIRRHPQALATSWAGRGSFKEVLMKHDLPFDVVVATGTPGYLVDRTRHQAPAPIAAEGGWLADEPDDFAGYVRRVSDLTEAPLLSPAQYSMLFELIAKEVNAHGYNFIPTSKTVRDQCVERGQSVSRDSVGFVLRGIIFAGHKLGASGMPEDPVVLGEAFRQNVENRCRTARFDPEGAGPLLRRWLLRGSLAPH